MFNKRTLLRILLLFALIGWVILNYFWQLSRTINFNPNQNHQLIGSVNSTPIFKNHHLSFLLQLKSLDGQKNQGQVKLNWYGYMPYVHEGETWCLMAKLKHANTEPNFKNFNYNRWLAIHNIQAVGYIQKSDKNHLIHSASESGLKHTVNRWRGEIRANIKASLKNTAYTNEAGLLSALTVGIRTDVTPQQWLDFRNTGTSHLMAISGLHIGLCAAFVFFLVSLLWRRSETLMLFMPAQTAGSVGALLAALLYSAMAGFALPTQRAFIMIATITLAKLSARNISIIRSLMIAFCLILIWDPLAIFSASYWLSFSAVALIAYGLSGRLNTRKNLWWRFGRVQWIITFGLMPMTLWFFQQSSLSALAANLAAIPTVSFIVVPLCLFGCVSLIINQHIAYLLFKLAAMVLHYLVLFLQYLASFPHLVWHFQIQSLIAFLGLLFAVLLLLAPRGLPVRWLGIMLLAYIIILT